MAKGRATEPPIDGRGRRFALVAARFNSAVVDRLIEGAVEALVRHGVDRGAVEVHRVPGAWEIPLALAALARRGGCDGLVALGAVIRGETPHFDYVSAECSRGIAAVSLEHDLPIGFGVLTCDTLDQALERAGGRAGNKGEEAALAALEMVDLLGRLSA
jgi:6,7-dimethyl-8-ribityllumazine synthase